MPENKPQSLANHARYDPLFHFFMAPLALFLLIWSIAHAFRHFSHEALAWVVAAILIFLAIFKARTYALKVQDRVIRLEERLRLANLLPADSPFTRVDRRAMDCVALCFGRRMPGFGGKGRC